LRNKLLDVDAFVVWLSQCHWLIVICC